MGKEELNDFYIATKEKYIVENPIVYKPIGPTKQELDDIDERIEELLEDGVLIFDCNIT